MMQAYTEEQRNELIVFNKEKLAGLKFAVKQHALKSVREELQKELATTEIALASLTAEPVKTKLKYSSALPKFIGETNEVESVHCWIHGDTPDYATNEEAYAEAQKMAGDLYTAPPVAVLRLPDEAAANEMLKCMYSGRALSSAMEAIKWHAGEVKRLNATAPVVPDEALIDKVCLTAAGIFGQDDPDEAQEIVNRIRAMLAAAPEVE